MSKRVYIPLVLVLLTVVSLIVWQSRISNSETNSPSQKKNAKSLPKEVTVTLDKKGFSPDVVTIKAGSAVRWKNASGDKQTVNSDDYPTNQKHKELNFGIFNEGSTVVYTFAKPGTYGYHNQFKPKQKGKIIVEK
jgi:plastocyanin